MPKTSSERSGVNGNERKKQKRSKTKEEKLAAFNHKAYTAIASGTQQVLGKKGAAASDPDKLTLGIHCQEAGSKDAIKLLVASVSTVDPLLDDEDEDDSSLDPSFNSSAEVVEDSSFTLINECVNFDFCDPREVKNKPATADLPYSNATLLETEVALECLKIAGLGEYPGLLVTELDGIGKVLHTNSTTTIEPGAFVVPYLGAISPAAFSLKPSDPGYDKLLTIIPHKTEQRRDIVCDPSKFGGIAQFASTCSPHNEDYKNCNVILLGKKINMDSDKQRVVFFLVAIKEIPPNTALVRTFFCLPLSLSLSDQILLHHCLSRFSGMVLWLRI